MRRCRCRPDQPVPASQDLTPVGPRDLSRFCLAVQLYLYRDGSLIHEESLDASPDAPVDTEMADLLAFARGDAG